MTDVLMMTEIEDAHLLSSAAMAHEPLLAPMLSIKATNLMWELQHATVDTNLFIKARFGSRHHQDELREDADEQQV